MPKRGENKELKIDSRLENLHKVREFIRKNAIKFGFDEIEAEKIVLAVDEVCTNSIKHSYRNKPDGEIKIEVKEEKDRFVIIISYGGLPFDPSKVKIESPVEKFKRTGKVKRGKLGMFIVHSFMDDVKYESKGDENVVVLIKFLSRDEKRR